MLVAVATTAHLEVLPPTGAHPVGRQRVAWTDDARSELHTARGTDRRVVAAQLWFPAQPDTGTPGSYVEDLGSIADGLVASGEVAAVQAWGLRFVRDTARRGAAVSSAESSYPLVVFSPGNATNAAFYAGIAQDLASHGYVVAGVDHPYQVAAVALPDGSVATYDGRAEGADAVADKIDERVEDIAFVLQQLRDPQAPLAGRIDFRRIAVVGHSNGGLAAAEACRRIPDVAACANLDGQSAGGPFSADAAQGAPEQPFLFLTKETTLHPEMRRRFEAAGAGAYRAVLPAAAHDHFADGARFRPTVNPFARPVDKVAATGRSLLGAFLDIHLRGAPEETLARAAATTDVYVDVYPLGKRPSLPNDGSAP